MEGKEEVQLVDMVLRIRNKLAEASDQNLPVPDIINEQLFSLSVYFFFEFINVTNT